MTTPHSVEPDEQGAVNPALTMQLQMASMFLGPILSDPETVDGIRDSIAAALTSAGITNVDIFTNDPNFPDWSLAPGQVAEVFISRVAQEFGFSIPGYETL